MLFRKKNGVLSEEEKRSIIMYTKDSIELENEKERYFVKNNTLLIIISTILLLPLIYTLIEVFNRFESVRLYTTIFGYTAIGILVICIIMNLVSLLFIRCNNTLVCEDINGYLEKLELVYLNKRRNNRIRRNLLFTSFIIFCSFFALIIASIIVIMILL